MQRAIDEVKRRREVQLKYNLEHNITPASISKPFRDKLVEENPEAIDPILGKRKHPKTIFDQIETKAESLTPYDRQRLIKKLEKEMRFEAEQLNFELAAQIRDKIRELKS